MVDDGVETEQFAELAQTIADIKNGDKGRVKNFSMTKDESIKKNYEIAARRSMKVDDMSSKSFIRTLFDQHVAGFDIEKMDNYEEDKEKLLSSLKETG